MTLNYHRFHIWNNNSNSCHIVIAGIIMEDHKIQDMRAQVVKWYLIQSPSTDKFDCLKVK